MGTSIDEQLTSISYRKRTVIGAVGGLVGGCAVFLIIFSIDASLGVVPGTFYKMIGIPIGLEGTVATVFGLFAHMLTAGLIGAVFCYGSGLHRKLDLPSSMKGALAGGVTGIAVYAVFFIPITLLIVSPSLEATMADEEGIIATVINIDSIKLVENMELIIIGSLEVHIVFGIIMGVFCAMVLRHEREGSPLSFNTKKTLKTVTIGIILATTIIGFFYAFVPNQTSSAIVQSDLDAELSKVVEGLTYAEFTAMSEQERTDIVKVMPTLTINLVLEKAKKYDSAVSEGMEPITSNIKSNDDLRFVQVTDFQGLKGMDVVGIAMVISAGDKRFLRFEEFDMTNGLDLYVYLTKSGEVNTGIEIGKLKGNHGDQNYEIMGINTNPYSVVVIYSKSFDMIYGTAHLPPK